MSTQGAVTEKCNFAERSLGVNLTNSRGLSLPQLHACHVKMAAVVSTTPPHLTQQRS